MKNAELIKKSLTLIKSWSESKSKNIFNEHTDSVQLLLREASSKNFNLYLSTATAISLSILSTGMFFTGNEIVKRLNEKAKCIYAEVKDIKNEKLLIEIIIKTFASYNAFKVFNDRINIENKKNKTKIKR